MAQPPAIAIHTALFANRDDLKQQPLDKHYHYLCFTDARPETGAYHFIPTPDLLSDPRRTSRLPKMLPHLFLPQYELTIWHDASIQFFSTKFIETLAAEARTHGLVVCRNPERDCIYQEAEWCLREGKDTEANIGPWIDRLRAEGYPERNGLVLAGLIARDNHRPDVVRFNRQWWRAYAGYSYRDQLSFNYVLWKYQVPCKVLEVNLFDTPYLRVWPHAGEAAAEK